MLTSMDALQASFPHGAPKRRAPRTLCTMAEVAGFALTWVNFAKSCHGASDRFDDAPQSNSEDEDRSDLAAPATLD